MRDASIFANDINRYRLSLCFLIFPGRRCTSRVLQGMSMGSGNVKAVNVLNFLCRSASFANDNGLWSLGRTLFISDNAMNMAD